MDEKLFRPWAADRRARETLDLTPAPFVDLVSDDCIDASLALDAILEQHDPPRRTLEGFVNRPDW